MKTQPIDNKTEFHKKVIQDLQSYGIRIQDASSIAFLVENDSDDICVDINAMSTGLHYNKKDIDKQEVLDAGFLWWSTWNYITSNNE